MKLYNEEKAKAKAKAKGKAAITDNLSNYGAKNAAEFIAEAWSEYLDNEKPRPIAVAVGTLIKKIYASKFSPAGSSGE